MSQPDCISLRASTAAALSELGLGDFHRNESFERMSWVVQILRILPDRGHRFPHGKWGTIQGIESQLWAAAMVGAGQIDAASQPRAEGAKT